MESFRVEGEDEVRMGDEGAGLQVESGAVESAQVQVKTWTKEKERGCPSAAPNGLAPLGRELRAEDRALASRPPRACRVGAQARTQLWLCEPIAQGDGGADLHVPGPLARRSASPDQGRGAAGFRPTIGPAETPDHPFRAG